MSALAAGYFGRRWDAPMFDHAIKIPVPVGEDCGYCTEPIEEDDSGTREMFISEGDGNLAHALLPVHIDCWLRSRLGDVEHLSKRCSCYGGKGHDDRPYRTSGRAVLAWLLEHHQGRFVEGS